MQPDYRAFEPSIQGVLLWAVCYVLLIVPWTMGILLYNLFQRNFQKVDDDHLKYP